MTQKKIEQVLQYSNDHFLGYALNHGFGDLHFKVDPESGMQAIIAIHNTNLGPALGGCRFIHYQSVDDAIFDAMRLARGMTYKSALMNLPLGGGKSVIIEPNGPYDRTAYLKQFGKFINELGGRYITALDSGTNLEDMDIIAEETSYVASLSKYDGDPSPYTARGVLNGIRAAVNFKLDKENLTGLTIAVQGLGHVGFTLCKYLHDFGVKLIVADVDKLKTDKAQEIFNAEVVKVEEIHRIPCDVFSPCALGGIINDNTINELQTNIIAGAANNQLLHTYHGQALFDKGILYAVDYVINAGGVIFAASKYLNTHEDTVNQQIDNIYTILLEIFDRSDRENVPTSEIANTIAEEKISKKNQN